jgi:hypothetical protein
VSSRPAHALPAGPVDLSDVLAELGAQTHYLRALVAIESGNEVIVRKTLLIDAQRPFHPFKTDTVGEFHSVKIDNPSAVAVDVRYDGTQPLAQSSDERVPPHMGRILTAPYDQLAIGIDPAVIPAGTTKLYVTYYSRAYPPSIYAFL